MNRYPLWKNLLIAAVLVLGFIYAVPNFFGEDPALQISALKQSGLTDQSLQEIKTVLEQSDLAYTLEEQGGKALLRFNSTPAQMQAKDKLTQALGSDYVVALNLAPAVPSFLRALGADPMKLGLDLRGGVHFLLQVDVNAAIVRHLEGFSESIKSRLREDKIHYRNLTSSKTGITVEFPTADDRQEAEGLILREFAGLQINPLQEDTQSFSLNLSLTDFEKKSVQDYALEQSMNTLRNRVNELGVAEAVVQRQGLDRIVVELPGVQDTAYAKDILGKTASLEFRLLNTEKDASQLVGGRAPAGTVLLQDREGRSQLFDKKVVLSGESIVGAQSGFDEMGKPAVFLQLGGDVRQFSRITGENVGNGMGTIYIDTRYVTKVVDGQSVRVPETHYEVISVATINQRLGNRFQITNMQSATEARNLALLLRAGALPAPIDYVEERIIGPSMGAENIEKGVISLLVGLGLVMIFMVCYYRLFGLVANLGLVFNLILLLALLSIIGATLTLPGIAAIVLTLGMAVDANVLIFERIREELRAGQSVQASINAGFNRAFVTILDANITTFIAALSLFAIGSGPIKGFALALILGLVTSVFTAVSVTRAMVNLAFGRSSVKKLSIGI